MSFSIRLRKDNTNRTTLSNVCRSGGARQLKVTLVRLTKTKSCCVSWNAPSILNTPETTLCCGYIGGMRLVQGGVF
jgi:hypothetical protein